MQQNLFLPKIAYFSMEIALEPHIPTYSGGLGVLAGDTLRSAADIGLPIIAVTLAYRRGYFHQNLDQSGWQSEEPDVWRPEALTPAGGEAVIQIEGRTVVIRGWKYVITGVTGTEVPVYLLDTNQPENSEFDRTLTDRLYGGDARYRLCQEAVLGMGGVALLRALGETDLSGFHMNEGHSALLAVALLKEVREADPDITSERAIELVRRRCIFTTHTPVPAGHDKFPAFLAERVLGDETVRLLQSYQCCTDGMLNMTYLALRVSRFVNGVAMRHGEVSQSMFPTYPVSAITNGVHAGTWTSEPFRRLYNRYLPTWQYDNNYLRYAIGIPVLEILRAHREAKLNLVRAVSERTGVHLDDTAFTIGFARRASTYKRADLLFHDAERLRWISRNVGPIQVVYAGKAHPADEGGKRLIQRVYSAAASISSAIRFVYVPDYNMAWGGLLTSGVDVWLNTPQRPQEASGTSGMKAAMNGVPSLSILDGWWVEGHIEGVTGWSIGGEAVNEDRDTEAKSLYDKLERSILPLYYARSEEYGRVMRGAIAFNGAFFNTQRMIMQYVRNAYLPAESGTQPPMAAAAATTPLVAEAPHV